MNKFFRIMIFLGVFGLMLAGCGGKSATVSENKEQTQPAKVLNLVTSVNSQHSLYEGLVKFKEIVDRESNQSIQVKVFHSGQMGGDREIAEAMNLGTIQVAIINPSLLANFVPEYMVFDLPFLFSNEQQVDRFLKDPVGQEILNSGIKKGYVGLSYMEMGFRNLTNNKHEIKSLQDLKDIKMRVTENPIQIDTWKTLGAKPTPISFTELFTALQQGTVDAQENSNGQIAASKFYEVQKYLTTTNHMFGEGPLIASKKFMDSLSETERQIIFKAASSASDHQIKINREREATSLQLLKDKGMIVKLNKFRQAVQPVYEKYEDKIGKDLLQRVLNAVK